MSKEFYVYAWSERGRVLYIGKGTGSRAGSHLRDKPWAKGRELELRLFPTQGEQEAYLVESFLIQLFRSEGLHNKVTPGAFRSFPLYKEDWERVEPVVREGLRELNTPPAFFEVEEALRLATRYAGTFGRYDDGSEDRDYLISEDFFNFLQGFALRSQNPNQAAMGGYYAWLSAPDSVADSVAWAAQNYLEDF